MLTIILNNKTADSIEDYLKEQGRIETLNSQLTNCDTVLQKMEKMLESFQSNLGDISEEIKNLQGFSFPYFSAKENRF